MSRPWMERELARHSEQVIRGEHDDTCEYGHIAELHGRARQLWVCHCAKRRREASGFIDPPGPVEPQPPACPRCYGSTDWDDGWWICEDCRVRWDAEDKDHAGEFCDDYGDLGVLR